MTFTVTYRGKDGRLVSEAFEAESRTRLFEILKNKGISAIRVVEGVVSKSGKSDSPSRSKIKSVLALSVAVLVAGVALFILVRGGDEVEEKKPTPVATKKVTSPKVSVRTNAPKAKVVKRVTEVKKKPSAWRDKNLSEEQRNEAYEKALTESAEKAQPTNRLFKTGVEQIMGWIFTTEVGEMPLPIPRIPDVDYARLKDILESKNEILPTDSTEKAYAKETVDFAKKVFKEYIEKGGEPDEFLEYYHAELKNSWQMRRNYQNEVMNILQTSPDDAQTYLNEVNKMLEEKGVKRVVIPERVLSRLGVTLDQGQKQDTPAREEKGDTE